MIRPALLALLLGSVALTEAVAQQSILVQPGQRVRVQSALARTPELIGGVQAISPDTLVVRHDVGAGASAATAIPLIYITRLEVSRGQHSRWLTGLVVGLAAGATTGVILGATSESDFLFSKSSMALMGAVVMAPIGGAVGLVVGALTKTERWETVPLPRPGKSVTLGPPGRLGLGVRVAF
jgi:hypothetical protein